MGNPAKGGTAESISGRKSVRPSSESHGKDTAMSVGLGWTDITIRLALTILVGIVIGYDRSAHGRAAGMRTTVLVCLAASVAMIQVNLLLPLSGRTPNSFVMNDLMRLPLGILTGMGFIGGGAILRRGSMVVGVTTAATLWLVTVIGLCLGGGQIALGLAATLLGLFALRVLHWVEGRLQQEHQARLEIELHAAQLGEEEIRRRLVNAGLVISGMRVSLSTTDTRRTLVFDVRRNRRPGNTESPLFLNDLAAEAGVMKVQWYELS